jgi:hypothetical protein
MHKCVFAICTAALFAIPSVAFSERVHIGPKGVKVVPGYHRYHAKQSVIEILRDTIRPRCRSRIEQTDNSVYEIKQLLPCLIAFTVRDLHP